MVKPPTFDSNGRKSGAWSKEEDDRLRAFVQEFGHNNWRLLPLLAGLARCGKSCRLRWVNYLKPGLKRGKFSKREEDLIIKFHNQLGNKWSAIAAKFPGKTDNEVKNYYHAHIKKRGRREKIIVKHEPQPSPSPSPSPSSSSCVTADDRQEESLPPNRNIEDALLSLSPIADLYSFAEEFSVTTTELTQHKECFDLPPFPVEDQYREFEFLLREMQNDAMNSADFQGNYFSCDSFKDDVLDMELW